MAKDEMRRGPTKTYPSSEKWHHQCVRIDWERLDVGEQVAASPPSTCEMEAVTEVTVGVPVGMAFLGVGGILWR